MKKMIEWSKFEKLERKYTTLCQKQMGIENQLKMFEKMPQAVLNHKTKDGLYLRRVVSGATIKTGIIYLSSTRIRKNHCDVCGKKRKTTGHHLIPRRLKSVNKELSQLKIRACKECERKIHPENAYEESEILIKQDRKIEKLKRLLKVKAESILTEFFELIDKRIYGITASIKEIPERLQKDPQKIQPALKQCKGRIRELKFLRGRLRKKVNMKLKTNK